MFTIFAEIGYDLGSDYTYDAKDNIIRFANGSEVLLLDMAASPQDPEFTRFGSLNLTWAWAEESNESPEKGIAILKTRVGRHNKLDGLEVKPFWLETFNPNKGHVHRNYYKPWKEGVLPPHRQFIRALPGDNPHLPDAYIENLKRADKVTRERLLYGNFDYDADPNRLMDYDAILDLKTNTIDAGTNRFLINDIARFGGDKIVLGEFEGLCLVGLTVNTYQGIEVTTKQIKDQAAESRIPFSHILSDEDGVGGGVVDNLRGTKGFLGGSRPLEIVDSLTGKMVAANFANLRSQCYFRLAELVNGHLMSIDLRYFKSNIEGYTEERALSDLEEELDHILSVDMSGQSTKHAVIPKSDIKERLGRSPDFADILMMRMLFELQGKDVVKKAQDPVTIILNRERRPSPAGANPELD
ncbi:hypothetical protein [Amorphus orientalis]|uniref:Uncharacterized protein n=1 Tax=Amorphus orientalis TaxID=649198 RepID=A0AAE3VQP2_9HYPH|nr:hypothetical protein [Amorphus orientalis]MDQ0316411.1 hypothetical protein [Amorphus orientalis]